MSDQAEAAAPTVTTTRENIGAIPYLGALPVPSRAWLRPLQGGCAVMAGLGLLQAVAYGQRAGLEHQRSAGLKGLALREQLRANGEFLETLSTVTFVAIIVTWILASAWQRRRRPRRLLARSGEALVETPLRACVPPWFRVLFLVAWFQHPAVSPLSPSAPLTDVSGSFVRDALCSASWAVGCLVYLWWTQRAASVTVRRISWSGPYRSGERRVPRIAPVSSWRWQSDLLVAALVVATTWAVFR
jgi:hypothetical protein